MNTVKATIVGCGAVAQRLYRKPLQQLARRRLIEIVSLVDPVAEHAAAMGRFFPAARRYASFDAALAGTPADLALILSPAHLHCRHATLALQHKLHVLCEKPMACSAGDCRQMNAAAAAAQRVLALGMIRRFFPSFAQVGQLVRNGALGTIRSFEYREGHKFEWDVTTAAAFRPRRDGGTGVLFDIGPHAFDYLEWLFGPLTAVAYVDDALGGIESNLSMSLRHASGTGAAHLSWDQPQRNELRIHGDNEDAVLRLDRFDQLAITVGGRLTAQPVTVSFPADASPDGRVRMTPKGYSDAMYCQLVQMVRSVLLGEPPAVDGFAGQRCTALLESALALAEPMPSPWLGPAAQHAATEMHWTRRA